MDDAGPLRVETDNVTVEVVDRKTAEAAMAIVEPVLTHHLKEGVGEYPPQAKTRYKYDAECPECGNEWTRVVEQPHSVVCPQCQYYWYITVDELEGMDVEVVEP